MHLSEAVTLCIALSHPCIIAVNRYHLLKPEYIHFRIRELQRSFTLRVLLCHVDVDDVVEPLQQVTRAAIANQLTLVCAWSDLVGSLACRAALRSFLSLWAAVSLCAANSSAGSADLACLPPRLTASSSWQFLFSCVLAVSGSPACSR